MDTIGTKIVEEQRAAHGLPTLKQAGREPRFIATAADLGLGVHNLNAIRLSSVEI
jgi:hypothetical protein